MSEDKQTMEIGADYSLTPNGLARDKYRYLLTRDLGDMLSQTEVTFVMLNPSTATEMEDDPTIRRCIYFARREGHGTMNVVNLSPIRATNPKWLRHFIPTLEAAQQNERLVLWCIAHSSLVIVAWGAHDLSKVVGATMVKGLVENSGVELWCLGKTMDGSPRHPLYVPKDTPLQRWG